MHDYLPNEEIKIPASRAREMVLEAEKQAKLETLETIIKEVEGRATRVGECEERGH